MAKTKTTSFKDATKKIKENYISSIIIKATEYSMDSLSIEEINEVEGLIAKLNNKTSNLVYSQFVGNIAKKGIQPESYKWLEKIAPQKLDDFVFVIESVALSQNQFKPSKNEKSFPFPLKREDSVEKDIAQNPFNIILKRAEKEEESLFFPMYKNFLNVMVEKTKVEPQDFISLIQGFIDVQCSYTKEVLKKLLNKHHHELSDEIKHDVALVILENENPSMLYRQYKTIHENGIEHNSSKLIELLKIINCSHILENNKIMPQFLFPCQYQSKDNDRCYLDEKISFPSLLKFIDLAKLTENEVKEHVFISPSQSMNEDKMKVSFKKNIENLKNTNRNISTFALNNNYLMIEIYNKIAKKFNFNKILPPLSNAVEERVALLEKINLETSIQSNTASKKIKI